MASLLFNSPQRLYERDSALWTLGEKKSNAHEGNRGVLRRQTTDYLSQQVVRRIEMTHHQSLSLVQVLWVVTWVDHLCLYKSIHVLLNGPLLCHESPAFLPTA